MLTYVHMCSIQTLWCDSNACVVWKNVKVFRLAWFSNDYEFVWDRVVIAHRISISFFLIIESSFACQNRTSFTVLTLTHDRLHSHCLRSRLCLWMQFLRSTEYGAHTYEDTFRIRPAVIWFFHTFVVHLNMGIFVLPIGWLKLILITRILLWQILCFISIPYLTTEIAVFVQKELYVSHVIPVGFYLKISLILVRSGLLPVLNSIVAP